MKQSTSSNGKQGSLHVAVIMDGNGRWAGARGLPRVEGHRAGAEAVRRTVEASARLGIGTLTLHAFSSDNWKRPKTEVGQLLRLFREYLLAEWSRCAREGIRLQVIGRRDRLPRWLLEAITLAEASTAGGTRLLLRIAVDYSAREAVLLAARLLQGFDVVRREDFARAVARAMHGDESTQDVDLLIRTGGEFRLSDLLGWDSAYAELVFTKTMWPDFQDADLEAAVEEFRSRERRFGGLPKINGPASALLDPWADQNDTREECATNS
jgi:undecaprenyl diphosphate synthase